MTLASLLSIILVGIISGNVISSSMVGVDLAGNNLNSIKNGLVLSLIVFGVSLVAGIGVFVINLALVASGNSGFLVVAAFLFVAVLVQIAEYILEKFFPIVHTNLGGFIVTLIPAVAVILFSIFTSEIKFLELLLNIVFVNLGITLVLTIIAGVRQNKLTYSSYDVFKGNLMTLAILFVLAILWTAV